jgi:hypothetical protein
MDYLGDYLLQEGVRQALQAAKRVRMTEQQKLEYRLYREACKISNVEPVRADFLAGDMPSCVSSHMELEQNEVEQQKTAKAFAAHA